MISEKVKREIARTTAKRREAGYAAQEAIQHKGEKALARRILRILDTNTQAFAVSVIQRVCEEVIRK